MKKKIVSAILVLTMCFGLTACGDSSTDSKDSADTQKTGESAAQKKDEEKEEKKDEPKEYGVGETWSVDGKFNFTFTSAALSEDRNPFDESNPAQVVLLTFDYENTGFEGIMDLYFSETSFTVIDEAGEVAGTYPLNISNYPQETPAGARCTGAQAAYGLKNQSSTITVTVNQVDNSFTEDKATFKLTLQ